MAAASSERVEHSFEAAARIIHQSVLSDGDGGERLQRAEAAFGCLARRGLLAAADLEVWCAMVGVRLESALDVEARVKPVVRAAQWAGGLSWDVLYELTLSEEAGRIEDVVREARAALAEALCGADETGQALLDALAARCGADASAGTLSRAEALAAFRGLRIGTAKTVGLCGACA